MYETVDHRTEGDVCGVETYLLHTTQEHVFSVREYLRALHQRDVMHLSNKIVGVSLACGSGIKCLVYNKRLREYIVNVSKYMTASEIRSTNPSCKGNP